MEGNIVDFARYLSAGICMGIGALGPGLGEGYAAGKACEAVTRNRNSAAGHPHHAYQSGGFTESVGIYALVISLLLLSR